LSRSTSSTWSWQRSCASICRYVRLRRDAIEGIETWRPVAQARAPLFVCSHNSARSQLAAAIWTDKTGQTASSAGTEPASQVHPGAVAAARRVGLDLSAATPRLLDTPDPGQLVVTVCDRAHEELDVQADWRHWSLADPVEVGTDAAFDLTITQLDQRITAMIPERIS
jgi:protein-tyrosine-phosphatase